MHRLARGPSLALLALLLLGLARANARPSARWDDPGRTERDSAAAAVDDEPPLGRQGALGSRVSLGVALRRAADERQEVTGSLLVELPVLAWLGASPSRAPLGTDDAGGEGGRRPEGRPSVGHPDRRASSADPHAGGPLELCDEPTSSAGRQPDRGERHRPSPPPTVRPRVRAGDARAAVRAALGAAGLGAQVDRLDELANRARWSAALPELRLRAARGIDESASLSPTSYDAERRTETGGSSLWLEARTTWHLDRALFAGEEIRLEQLRHRAADQRQRLARQVLDLLFAWERARVEVGLLDPGASPAECWDAILREQQLAVELDVRTGGWLGRWRRGATGPAPLPACARSAQGSRPGGRAPGSRSEGDP